MGCWSSSSSAPGFLQPQALWLQLHTVRPPQKLRLTCVNPVHEAWHWQPLAEHMREPQTSLWHQNQRRADPTPGFLEMSQPGHTAPRGSRNSQHRSQCTPSPAGPLEPPRCLWKRIQTPSHSPQALKDIPTYHTVSPLTCSSHTPLPAWTHLDTSCLQYLTP